MLDGKVAVTDTVSANNCFFYKVRPSKKTDLTKLQLKPFNHEALKLGILPLHAVFRNEGPRKSRFEIRKSKKTVFNKSSLKKLGSD